MAIIGLTSVCTVVFSNTRVSVFRVANFHNGNIIASNGGVTRKIDCLLTCGGTCGYVQYRADDTCVLYSQALLLTEPAAVEGQIQGYQKVSGIHLHLKTQFLLNALEGANEVTFLFPLMNNFNQIEAAVFSEQAMFPQDFHISYINVFILQLVFSACIIVAVKCQPVLHHCVVKFSSSLGSWIVRC